MVDEKRIVPVIILDEGQFLKTEILNDLIILDNFFQIKLVIFEMLFYKLIIMIKLF